MFDRANEGRILVELYCMRPDCEPIEELVTAVANSVRWKDRVDLRIRHVDDHPVAATPYGLIDEHTVVVCGTHVIRNADYHAITRALEDCSGPEPI